MAAIPRQYGAVKKSINIIIQLMGDAAGWLLDHISCFFFSFVHESLALLTGDQV
jgi:hypothetical protein